MRLCCLLVVLLAGVVNAQLFPVRPVQAGANLAVSTGRFFSYALPQGWRVGEEGQFALSLVSADSKAITVMVGNAGMPVNYPAGKFIFEKMSAMRPQNLQIGQGRAVAPLKGFAQAFEFDISYSGARGLPNRGVAKCHIAPAYDSALMVMTAAVSAADQWAGYSSWLPLVAEQISATSGAAFGRRGIMAQNLKNSQEFGEAARRYREWSQRNWQGVVDARNASQDKQNREVRELLGGVQSYADPFEPGRAVELPDTYKYYWSDGRGGYLGSDDPSANPGGVWRRMPKRRN